MYFLVKDLLPAADLAKIRQLLKSTPFIDGQATVGALNATKSNLEAEVGMSYASVVDILNRNVEASQVINMRLIPRFRTNPIVNRYDIGMYYRNHVDAPVQGGATQLGRAPGRFGQNFIRTDYSMTVFLSNPEDYDGGELELNVHDETRLIKLPAGSAVCYSTGIPHSVRPVASGSRIAAIYWLQSMIRDVQLRRLHWDQYCLEQSLVRDGHTDLAEAAGAVRANMIRYLAEI